MRARSLVISLLLVCALYRPSTAAIADGGEIAKYIDTKVRLPLTGSEELPRPSRVVHTGLGASRSPGVMIGDTYYDYQQNGSMGRQVVYTFEGSSHFCGVHFVWMCLSCDGDPGYRHVRYNAFDSVGNWCWGSGSGAGKEVYGENGGYCSIDATYYGASVISHHYGPVLDFYHSWVLCDLNPPLGYWSESENPGPAESDPQPNCQQISTGIVETASQYIWPKVEYDVCGDDSIFHKVCTESASAIDVNSVVYYRDVWDADLQAIIPPVCGTFIDSVFTISAVVRQDPNSDEVAIIWGHPIHYEGDITDPCGMTQWQNDVWVWYSYDCGATWDPADRVSITDYTQGGTIPIDEVPALFYSDLSALYDHNGTLHVVWSTPLREGCDPLYASRIWHWDDGPSGCISTVYDASKPQYFHDIGAWNNSTCKMSISECLVDDTTRLYCQFTRFGAYTSSNGDTSADSSAGRYENGEIFLVGSSDGGETWSQAINLTNTFTSNCEPGDCSSEHWSSMAKYSNDSLHIMYIEDKDAGAMPNFEGTMTCNPVRYLRYECFTPGPNCKVAWDTPNAGEYPDYLYIEPPGCPYDNWPDTASFDLVLTCTGNVPADYSVTSTAGWMGYAGGDPESGTLQSGCEGNSAALTYTVGPVSQSGVYEVYLLLTTCDGQAEDSIPITVYVDCRPVQCRELLMTACWSVGVWCEPRAGTGEWDAPEGNMYWFTEDAPFMYDGGLVISYADDSSKTWFSLYDGSDSDAYFLPTVYHLTTGPQPDYDSAVGDWVTQDGTVLGKIEYYLPHHFDTCVLIEKVGICNNTDTVIRLHIGEGIDWDVPYGEEHGYDNRSGIDAARDMVYQYGPDGTIGEDFYAGASLCHDGPGAIVLENDIWVWPNTGYDPPQVGGLLARHTNLEVSHPDSTEDLNSFYVIDRDVELSPDSCVIYCMVKASSNSGLNQLLEFIDRGKEWVENHELCLPCRSCYCEPGNVNGDSIPEDIDDVVYKILFVFASGPPPAKYPICSCDVDCSCECDIDDIVYEIEYIFSGGPSPCTCEEWANSCGQLR